jgi:hypothetical protein
MPLVKKPIPSPKYATDSEYLRELIRRDQAENKEIAYIRSRPSKVALLTRAATRFPRKLRIERVKMGIYKLSSEAEADLDRIWLGSLCHRLFTDHYMML